MNNFARLALLIPASAFVLLAQGPPRGGFGGGPGFGGPGGPGRGAVEKVVAGAPFAGAINEQRQQLLPDGKQLSTESETKIYRDSQGRVRREITRTGRDGTTLSYVTLFDPVAGFEARLDPEQATAQKRILPAEKPAAAGTAQTPPREEGGPHEVTTEDLGTKTIDGLVATGKRMSMTMPANAAGNNEAVQTVREVWTSTALQTPVLMTSSNPRFGSMKMELTGVTQSEPDASLFQIPSNYKVTTMSGHMGYPGNRQ